MKFHLKSISSRLIAYVTLAVMTMFTFIVGLLMVIQLIMAEGMFSMFTSWFVDSRAAEVNKRLAEVQSTILNHEIKVANNLHSTARLSTVFNDILYNQNIHACGIALEPDSLTKERSLLYAWRDESNSVKVTKRPADYRYEKQDYYKEAKKRMQDYWSDPYLDDTVRISTFSHPITDSDGNFLGVLCADVLLDSISSFVATNPTTSNVNVVQEWVNILFPNEVSFILSRNGFFITTPDSTVSFCDTYETYALRHECTAFKDNGLIIVERPEGKSAENLIEIDGKSYRLAYSYITNVGWTVVTLFPTEIVDKVIKTFIGANLAFILIGLLILVAIIYFVVKRSTKPLKKLVKASKDIAHGNFDVELPKVEHRDEVQTLRDSFDEMRLSLKDYVTQLKETTAENERMERDLNIASEIQISMLPKSFPKPPEVPEISIAALMKPAREVGGDLYDFFIRRGHLYFIMGDVSGKGVPAAMIMAVTNSMFRARLRKDVGPERTVKALNNMLLERNTMEMFVTLIVGDLNLTTGDLYLCNAGHNPAIIVKGKEKKAEFVTMQKNIPIGVFQNYHYRADRFQLAKGDRLFLYTDGVTEATNVSDALFGEDRLLAATRKYSGKDVEPFVDSMMNDIHAFTGDTPQSDDITMMMIEYHGSQNILTREMAFENDIKEVSKATALIEEVCEKLSVDPALSTSLQLALEEAMVNVISYAYENGRANIDNHFKITSDGKSITFILTDNGMPFDPTKQEMPDTTLGIEERGVGGLGILLLKKLMDDVTYERTNNRNILTMTKNI